MSPPSPPSPPSGPPLGTYFSRRKLTHPLPPSPPFTSMVARSMSMAYRLPPFGGPGNIRGHADTRKSPSIVRWPRGVSFEICSDRGRTDADLPAVAPAVLPRHNAVDQRKEGVVAPATHVGTRPDPGTALPDQHAAGRDE